MRVSVWLFTALVPATGYANLIYNGDFEGRPIGDGWLAGGVARFLEEGGNTLADVRSFYDGAIVNGGDIQQVVRTKPVPGTLCLDLDLTIAYGAFGVYFDDTELFSISSYEEEPLRIRRRLELDASAEMDGEWKVLAISSSCLLREGASIEARVDNVTLEPVPEPATLSAVALGLVALARRRKPARSG